MLTQQVIAAGKFKAECLSLMDEVQASGVPLVVTKRGHPVVKMVPIDDEPEQKSLYGCMAGTIEITGDIISPIDVKWDADQ